MVLFPVFLLYLVSLIPITWVKGNDSADSSRAIHPVVSSPLCNNVVCNHEAVCTRKFERGSQMKILALGYDSLKSNGYQKCS